MPYIDEKARYEIDTGRRMPDTPGELNYVLTAICASYLLHKAEGNPVRYSHLNDVMGALTGCGQELHRRLGAKLEDDAIQRNGDVFPMTLLLQGEHPNCGTADCCMQCSAASTCKAFPPSDK